MIIIKEWNHLKFKFWSNVFVFHFSLIPLKKAWTHLFYFQLVVNSRVERFPLLRLISSLEGKFEFK